MGIQGLARLIADVAPEAIKEVDLASFFGRRIAIDASMSLYQFLVAIRYSNHVLTNESGEATSHIIGFFYRTCKLLEAGIKPIYVFDGKPPHLKSGELDKRKERRADAQKKLDEATTAADAQKFEKRLVKVTKNHNEDVKKLLRLMGLPVIEAPSEAEAQCAQMCKEGLVYGVATEDMDALTFGSLKVIRNLSSGSGEKVKEYDLHKALDGLKLTHSEFIDLCILMGCDYCDTIRGIGPKKGLDLIRKHNSIEDVLREKFNITEFVEDVEVTYQNDRPRDTDIGATSVKSESQYVAKVAKKFTGIHDVIKAKVGKELSKWDNGEVKTESNIEDLFNKELDKEISPASSPSSSPKKALSTPKKEKKDESDGDIKFQMNSEDEYDPSAESQEPEPDEEFEKDVEEVVSDAEAKNEEDEEEEEEEKPKKKGKGTKKAAVKAAAGKSKKGGEKKPMYQVPDNWLFKGARRLFVEPQVLKNSITENDLKIKDVDEAGLVNFLVSECAFNEDRVRAALKRIESFKKKSSQSRIDSFFRTVPRESPTKKRPVEDSKSKGSKSSSGSSKATASKRGRRGR